MPTELETESVPSAEVQAPEQAATEASSAEVSEEPKLPNLFERIFPNERVKKALLAATKQGTEEQETPSAAATPGARTYTQEELDRLVQSETDRREAKRKADEERQARLRLREENPYEYVEQEKAQEARQASQQEVFGTIQQIVSQVDSVTLAPLLKALPQLERERIEKLEGAGKGLHGRQLLTVEALKVLEKHWRTLGAQEAEDRLRKNPAFRKNVFAELRGQTEEPELIEGQAKPGGDPFMEQIFGEYRALRG